MKLIKSFKIAFNIIIHSKVRSWLTILGIVIGIAAIVSIVSIGQGAQKTLEANLNSLNANIISISSGSSRAVGPGVEFRGPDSGGFGGGGRSSTATAKNLTARDAMNLKSVPNVDEVMGTISGSSSKIIYMSETARANIQGVETSVWKKYTTTQLASGRFLTQGDTNVVVVGSQIVTSTFTDLQINRQISIEGKMFRVVGILKESGGSEDRQIIMPIENAVDVLEDKYNGIFDSISVLIKDISISDETVTALTSKMMLSHGILTETKKDFSVTSQKSIQERVTSTLSSMSLFLGAIAAISLIVGAIGIMNSMFTSVLEKTRDIGVLKALGAKNSDILAIFLLNSGIIGLIGGILGVLFGMIGSAYIGNLAGFTGSASGGNPLGRILSSSYVSPQLIIGVFILSMVVGLISGAVPAYRASRLKPVEALRYE